MIEYDKDLTQQLATLVIRDFVPENILEIKPSELLKFREKYRDERRRFLAAICDAAKAFSESEDETVCRDKLEDLKKEIEKALADYKSSMETLKVTAWTGIKSISFPVLTKIASVIAGKPLHVTTLSIISVGGIALGLVSGISEMKQEKKHLEEAFDYSYLMHLGRNWKRCASYDNDYNYFLCRQMEEFIND